MPDQLGRSRRDLRRVTRTLELRNRLRHATTVIESMDTRAVAPRDRSVWGHYKHYVWAMGGAVVGGISVLIGAALLDGLRTTGPGESAKITSPMIIAIDRALAQADQLAKILETIVDQGPSKAHSEEPGRRGEYKECLDICAKSIRVDDESDKWLLLNCRNECIAQYSKRVKEIRKLYRESD